MDSLPLQSLVIIIFFGRSKQEIESRDIQVGESMCRVLHQEIMVGREQIYAGGGHEDLCARF